MSNVNLLTSQIYAKLDVIPPILHRNIESLYSILELSLLQNGNIYW